MNSQIERKLEAFAKKSTIPQLNVGIWHSGSFYESSFGCNKQTTVDVFETGSVGKTFTAALLAVLVEKKVVDLNDKLDKFRADLPFAKDITLLQLVTHTSGLPSYPFKKMTFNFKKALINFSEADYGEFLTGITKPLKTGKFEYANLGMALLGNTLADHLNMSYEDAVKKHILEPLGMTDTHVSPGVYDVNRVAIGHNGKGNAMAHFHWSCMEPAGVWRSTTKDMIIFLKAHLGHSGEYWENLLHKTTQRAFDDPKHEHVGLAWQLSNNKEFGDFAWHNGQTLGQKSVVVCAKANDSAIVMMTNKIPKLWQHFFKSYSIEKLSFDILESLSKTQGN